MKKIVLSFTLVLSGFLVSSSAYATTAIHRASAVISPSTSFVNENKIYTYTITNNNLSTAGIGSIEILLPVGFQTPSVISISSSTSNRSWSVVNTGTYANGYDISTRKVGLKANTNSDKLDANQFVQVQITTIAPSTFGTYEWSTGTTSANIFAGLTFNSSMYDLTSSQPAVSVSKITPTLTWSAPSNITNGTALSGTQLNATSSVSGTYVYNYNIGDILNAGNYVLSASFTPTDIITYATTSVTTSLTVNKLDQTVSIASIPNKTFGDADFAIDATTTSGLTLAIDATGTCSYMSSSVHLLGDGSCTVNAEQSGNNNYNYASSSVSFLITLPLSDSGDDDDTATSTDLATSSDDDPSDDTGTSTDDSNATSSDDTATSTDEASTSSDPIPPVVKKHKRNIVRAFTYDTIPKNTNTENTVHPLEVKKETVPEETKPEEKIPEPIPELPKGEVLGAEKFFFAGDLRFGMKSDSIIELQERLRTEGFFTYATSTGYFGKLTREAVKKFQKDRGIAETGLVGELTREPLNK